MTLPSAGATDWGTTLNAHINIEHNADGTHNIPNATIQAGISGSTTASLFGDWTTDDSGASAIVKDSTYLANCDGFVTVYRAHSGTDSVATGLTDSANPPTTVRAEHSTGSVTTKSGGFMMPVKSGEYFKITMTNVTPTIYWLPFGTGTVTKQ